MPDRLRHTESVTTGGIVLSGGQSTRMGTSKALLPFGDETMLQRVVRLLSTVVDPIVVVAAAGQSLPDLPADVIVTSDDVAKSKPAPDIYLLVCERLGFTPNQVLALEDSSAGVASAKAAGLSVIAVPQFAETDVGAADRIIDSLEELLPEF